MRSINDTKDSSSQSYTILTKLIYQWWVSPEKKTKWSIVSGAILKYLGNVSLPQRFPPTPRVMPNFVGAITHPKTSEPVKTIPIMP